MFGPRSKRQQVKTATGHNGDSKNGDSQNGDIIWSQVKTATITNPKRQQTTLVCLY